jgi:hypothetical protein
LPGQLCCPLYPNPFFLQGSKRVYRAQGLTIKAALDSGAYPTGLKVTDQELAGINLKPAPFHGDWNYCILPSRKKK